MYLPNYPDKLSLSSSDYVSFLDSYTDLFLEADRYDSDSSLFVVEGVAGSFDLICRTDAALFAGREELTHILTRFGVKFEWFVNDGDTLGINSKILTVDGLFTTILPLERFLLDLLSRMTGIATSTSRLINLLGSKHIKVAATRKTVLPMIDKKAVSVGGGITHRLNLKHAVILKDNHKFLSIVDVLRNIDWSEFMHVDFFEIEVETESELSELEEYLKVYDVPVQLGILLDNFTPQMILAINERLLKLKHDYGLFIEASGGINSGNVSMYTASALDFVSSGALTSNPVQVDFSLELEVK